MRNLSGHVHFNLDAFPWFENHKYGTVLVQHYQMDWCRTIIAEQEQRVGVYKRVARLRTDVIFSGLPKRHAPVRVRATGFPTAAAPDNAPAYQNTSAYQEASGAYLTCRLGGQAGEASRGRPGAKLGAT